MAENDRKRHRMKGNGWKAGKTGDYKKELEIA
jgi:hypothetical protein